MHFNLSGCLQHAELVLHQACLSLLYTVRHLERYVHNVRSADLHYHFYVSSLVFVVVAVFFIGGVVVVVCFVLLRKRVSKRNR